MITEYDTEIATLVLPVSNIDDNQLDVFNKQAGSGTIIEIVGECEVPYKGVEIIIDYSLCDFETMEEAYDHLGSIVRDILEELNEETA
jgi:hypothetical protein